MRHLDLRVVEGALEWARRGEPLWLCSVVATFGSSPREPGSLLVALGDGRHLGSLSGGCVEEAFLARLLDGGFTAPATLVSYGDGSDPGGVRLPCGGVLKVLVERLAPDAATLDQLQRMRDALAGGPALLRRVSLTGEAPRLLPAPATGARVAQSGERIDIRIGPALRLVIAGLSSVAEDCARFALALGFEVIVCEPREEARDGVELPGVRLLDLLPARYLAEQGCHAGTAVVALTHDPRLDDLTMIEAVRGEAFYIGVMGSRATSARRAERLKRCGGLDDAQIARLHMPIGLDLGSRTPAEIALAVMADILRVYRDRDRASL